MSVRKNKRRLYNQRVQTESFETRHPKFYEEFNTQKSRMIKIMKLCYLQEANPIMMLICKLFKQRQSISKFAIFDEFFQIIQYSMCQQGVKGFDFQELEEQGGKIKSCLDKFPIIEQKIEDTQLTQIKNKYQYQLRTFQKITEEHLKYKIMYENIESMIEESNQMKEENSSIEFIKKIMEDTQRRYNVLKDNIQSLRHNKEETKQQLKRLKSILKKIKRDYFELQRKQSTLNESMRAGEQAEKRSEIHKTMFKIRSQKKASKAESGKIKPIPFEKLITNTQVYVDRKISQQLQLINKIKEQFLHAIGININQYYKISQKTYAHQNYANLLIKKRQFKIKDKCVLKGIQNYDPTGNAVQVFKMAEQYDNEKEAFMRLGGQEIMDMIIRKNKVGQVLHLIEGEKKQILDTYKCIKNVK